LYIVKTDTRVKCMDSVPECLLLQRDATMVARSWGRNSVRPSVTRVLCD